MNQRPSENQVFTTGDGSESIISGRFGERYHSRFGAVTECYHISILHGFKAVLPFFSEVAILEIGFGTGLNAWLTFIESIEHPEKCIRYTALEGFPLEEAEVEKLNYKSFFPQFGTIYNKMHETEWAKEIQLSQNFLFSKVNCLFEDFQYPSSFYNLVLYDPFAPGCQPEMWGVQMLEKMFNAMGIGGMLVTYCAQGAFRRSLKECGFAVEKLPGPPGKREMTRAVKNA